MKKPMISIYESARKDMKHYIYRTQDKALPRSIEEYINNHEPVGGITENVDVNKLKTVTVTNVTMANNGITKGVEGFVTLSLPFDFCIPGSTFTLSMKNNVETNGVVHYTIHIGFNVIFKVVEEKENIVTEITDIATIESMFKLSSEPNAILINKPSGEGSLITFTGDINIYEVIDDGTSPLTGTVYEPAHGVYVPTISLVETKDYFSFYQNAETRKKTYFYNVISALPTGEVSELSNTKVCEIAEDVTKMNFVLESSDDYYISDNPTWDIVSDNLTPNDEIRASKDKGEITSKIINIDNFFISVNDEDLRYENLRLVQLTNVWNSLNRGYMSRKKKVFRAKNVFPDGNIESEYCDVIEIDGSIEVLIDKIMVLKKDVTSLSPADAAQPIAINDPNAETLKVYVRQGGIYFKDFFLNNTNDAGGNIPNNEVTSVTLDSRFPLLTIKDQCLYGNKYNYTVYIYDEIGEVSEPISAVF